MHYEDSPRSIKYYVKRYLIENAAAFAGKRVVDFPAGNGVTSRIARELGANPIPLDLFPEYFTAEGIECRRANIAAGLPLEDASADVLICQEGIEHFSDQMQAFREFNRVLRPGGTLLVTTPNYSNLRSKLSYLLSESERFGSIAPPNEIDSIWMSKKELTDEIYYGHIFLLGIQKLRVFGRLSGFRIKKIHATKPKSTSLWLLPACYPFILLTNLLSYRKSLRKNTTHSRQDAKRIYGEILRLAINPRILVDGHLMVEYEKEMESAEVVADLKSKHQEFGLT